MADLILSVEELDGSAFERTAKVWLTIKGKPTEVEVGTRGWEDAKYAYMKAKPRPAAPYRDEIVKRGSAEAVAYKAAGGDGISTVRRYDPGEPSFLVALEQWQDGLNYYLAAHCLRITLTQGGVPVTDTAVKAGLLQRMGLTPREAAGIARKVVETSELEVRDAVDFSGGGSDVQTSNSEPPSPSGSGTGPKLPDSAGGPATSSGGSTGSSG